MPDIVPASEIVVPCVIVFSLARRVDLWMLGVARFRWSAGAGSGVTLIVFHVGLNCPCKCKWPTVDNGPGFQPLQLLGQTLVRSCMA